MWEHDSFSHPSANRQGSRKLPFALSAEARGRMEFSTRPVSLQIFVYRVNQLIDPVQMTMLSATVLQDALLSHGYLAATASEGGVYMLPTKKGEEAGMTRRLPDPLLLDRRGQVSVFSHLHALLGLDASLDAGPLHIKEQAPARPAPKPTERRGTPASGIFFCWSCEGKAVRRYTFKCPTCGWPICPKCGVCKSPQTGGCSESRKGLARFTGLMREKNDLRTVLLNHRLLDADAFSRIVAAESSRDLDRVRESLSDSLAQIESLRDAKREEKQAESAEKVLEIQRNARGFYKIVTKTDRLITYQTAKGQRRTVPNRPPIRVGKEWVDLSMLKPEARE